MWVGGVRDGAGGAATLVGSRQVLAGDAEAAGTDCLALIYIHTANLRVAGVARLALTHVAAGKVRAESILSAGSRGSTLIDIDTSSGDVLWVVGPTILADTVGVLLLRLTVGVLTAGNSLARLRARHGGGVSHKGGWAGAGVGAAGILADGVRSTDSRGGATLVNIQAEGASGCEALATQAFSALTHGIVGAVKV